ncbi:MAG: glutaredoxin domain-containing protein, partial [Pseudomonadota bacterium]
MDVLTPLWLALVRGETMQSVEIYTSAMCGFCFAAKRLLKQKGISFSEIDV